MTIAAVGASVGADPMQLRLHRVVSRRRETYDTITLALAPVGGGPAAPFAHGQFNMLTCPGAGEVPISISGSTPAGAVLHTIRSVGAATDALCRVRRGDVLGLRGPFGNGWDIDWPSGDLVIVGGGLGLAPLRSAIVASLRLCGREGRRLFVLAGARTPGDLLFGRDLDRWNRRPGVDVQLIVDHAEAGWRGQVGLVTKLVTDSPLVGAGARALVCGPEVMMRFTVAALADRGIPVDRIQVSLERNMKCGIGWCGHCQLGPVLLCRDGPVLRADRASGLFKIKEL